MRGRIRVCELQRTDSLAAANVSFEQGAQLSLDLYDATRHLLSRHRYDKDPIILAEPAFIRQVRD